MVRRPRRLVWFTFSTSSPLFPGWLQPCVADSYLQLNCISVRFWGKHILYIFWNVACRFENLVQLAQKMRIWGSWRSARAWKDFWLWNIQPSHQEEMLALYVQCQRVRGLQKRYACYIKSTKSGCYLLTLVMLMIWRQTMILFLTLTTWFCCLTYNTNICFGNCLGGMVLWAIMTSFFFRSFVIFCHSTSQTNFSFIGTSPKRPCVIY